MTAATYRTEAAAWLAIVEALEVAPGVLEPRYRGDPTAAAGLCAVVRHLRTRCVVTPRIARRMLDRIDREVRRRGPGGGGWGYLHAPSRWGDGVRLGFARRFLAQARGGE